MEKWRAFPFVLQRRIFFTLLTGAGSVVVSTVICIISQDRILLGLSGLIFFCCLLRSKSLWTSASQNRYEVIKGTCTGITAPKLGKYRKIELIDEHGTEITLLLSKEIKVKIGTQYCFYFQNDHRFPTGNEYLDASLSTNSFLGCEESRE